MTEVIGLAASVVALVQLAGQLTCVGYGYIGAVKRAPKDLRQLVDELHSLGKILISLQDYADTNPQSTSLQKLNEIDGPIKGCINELNELKPKLEPKGGFRGFVAGLKWPLKETETTQIISRIERHKSLFIFALTADQIALSKQIEAYVQETNVAVKTEFQVQDAWRQKEEAKALAEKCKIILDWLYPEDFNTKHVEITNRRQEATGMWLMKAPEFLSWVKGPPDFRLLWGCGIPGAGKTFLSSVMIDYFKGQAQAANYGVAHIYFDYKEQERQKPVYVLASLVKQLLVANKSSDLPAAITDLHVRAVEESRRPTLEELYGVFLAASKPFSRVFLIFDALDECNVEKQRKQLLPLFRRMGKDGINVFLTSRPHPEDIQDALSGPDSGKIELLAQEEDIAAYIEQRIEENSRARRLVKQGKCKDRIISELVDCSKGMFLLVRFHIEFLCQQTSARQILKALEKLKTSSTGEKQLYPTYDRVIESIRAQEDSSSELAFNALSWLVKARRTLTVGELLVAVSVEQDLYELDDMDLPDSAILLDVCAGLVIIDELSGTIKLAHHTIQEYLVKNSVIHPDTDFRLAMACTTYLSFDALALGPCTTPESFKGRLELLPFLDYAAHQLPEHLSICEDDLPTDVILKFSESSGNVSSYLQAHSFSEEYQHVIDHYPKGVLPLHVTSSFGHLEATRLLLEGGAEISIADEDGKTALYYAACQRREGVVRLLLESGANTTALCNDGDTVLHGAATGGHVAVAQLLLDSGLDVCVAQKWGQTALHRAAYFGHSALVQLLLNNGADNAALDDGGETPLHYAASKGYEEVVRVLLENGAEVSPNDQNSRTPLQIAAGAGHEATVKLLIEKGADTSAQNFLGRTALSEAVNGGHEEVVRVMLEKGADPSIPDIYGETPLHKAANRGQTPLVELLLDYKADILAQTNNGWTALHLAAATDNVRLIRLLLDKGADISVRCNYGKTALHWAMPSGYEAVVKLLLDEGVDVSAQTGIGHTALHYAIREGHEKVVQLLLEKDLGEQLSVQDGSGETPLFMAANDGNGPVVRLLLDKGADVDIVQEDGKTPLYAAALEGHEAVVRMLLDNGADASIRENGGETALSIAKSHNHDDVVQLLEVALLGAVGSGSP